MKNNKIEILIDEYGNKFHVLVAKKLDENTLKSIKTTSTQEVFKSVISFEKKYYYKGKMLHREDGPSIEHIDGSKYWYKHGKLHRENAPAIEYNEKTKYWYKNGMLHREDGPAIEEDGDNHWYKNGIIQRTEHACGDVFYYENGKLHKEDGPAINYNDENEPNEYWINGVNITEEIFYLEKDLRKNLNKDKKINKIKI